MKVFFVAKIWAPDIRRALNFVHPRYTLLHNCVDVRNGIKWKLVQTTNASKSATLQVGTNEPWNGEVEVHDVKSDFTDANSEVKVKKCERSRLMTYVRQAECEGRQ